MAKTAFLEVPIMTNCGVCGVGYKRTQHIKIRMTWLGRIYWAGLVKIDQEAHRCGTELERHGP